MSKLRDLINKLRGTESLEKKIEESNQAKQEQRRVERFNRKMPSMVEYDRMKKLIEAARGEDFPGKDQAEQGARKLQKEFYKTFNPPGIDYEARDEMNRQIRELKSSDSLESPDQKLEREAKLIRDGWNKEATKMMEESQRGAVRDAGRMALIVAAGTPAETVTDQQEISDMLGTMSPDKRTEFLDSLNSKSILGQFINQYRTK